jgi:hypothetical protein
LHELGALRNRHEVGKQLDGDRLRVFGSFAQDPGGLVHSLVSKVKHEVLVRYESFVLLVEGHVG